MADEDLKVNILVDSGVYEIRRRKKAPKEGMKFMKTMKTKSKSCFISYHTSADDFCNFMIVSDRETLNILVVLHPQNVVQY